MLPVALLLLLCACAVGVLLLSDLVGAIFLLSCYSFFLALLWTFWGAADVAFTEAVVGAGASTVFFLLALFQMSPVARTRKLRFRHGAAFLSLGALGLLLFLGVDFPFFGAAGSPAHLHVSPAYILRAMSQMKTPNLVTAILADYRGFDTLIETAVIFTAGVACLLILEGKRGPSAR
ncbi:MAG: DUF4040 domain-containing protein [Elusimicrobia bacterium]|nr:DUF4040 domain-containing protein [Elusimicrobiota bacterium]